MGGHTLWVSSVAEFEDRRVVSGGFDMTVRVWDIEDGNHTCGMVLNGHTSYVLCVAASNDGLHIISGAQDNTLRVWNSSTGDCLWELVGHTEWVPCVVELYDGTIVSGSNDSTIRLWDITTGECTEVLHGHQG